MNKTIRIVGLIAVFALIIAAIVASVIPKPESAKEHVWDTATTTGDLEAKNHYVIYSDLVCPYCIAFENAIVEHKDEFQEYIKKNDILVEVRLSDFLYEYGESNPINSRYSALATYCAKSENKFWDYYDLAVTTVWNDFFRDLGKGAFTQMSNLTKDYWIDIGKKVGLSDSFESCVKNETPLEEIKATAKKSARLVSGMPYFKFNNYTSSGFDLSWGWNYVVMYLDAGLEKKS